MTEDLGTQGRQLLMTLWNRGPAMPVELAAQCYSFPDEITPALKTLQESGLVEMKSVTRSGMGGSLIYLSDRGREWVKRDLLESDSSTGLSSGSGEGP